MKHVRWTMSLLAILFAMAAGVPAGAATYYVSASGNDLASGQSSKTLGTNDAPFATLRPLERLDLHAGDSVLLACGERFKGPLQIKLNAGGGAPVTFGHFGDCASKGLPTLDGREQLQSDAAGSAIQEIKVPARVSQVFLADVPLAPARFPEKGYLMLNPSAQSVDHLLLQGGLSDRPLNGARLVARTQEWYIEERTIVDDAGALDSKLEWPLRAKTGVYLLGKRWMIGPRDAWAYDEGAQTLYIRNSLQQPVWVSYARPLLKIEGKGSVMLDGVAFDGAGADAVDVHVDGDVGIHNTTVSRSARNGISVAGARNADVSDSRVDSVARDGIFFAEVQHVVVRHNLVTNAGVYLGPRPSLAAINAHRTNSALIEENRVINAGYIGIRFAGDAKIRRNVVEHSCRTMSDCAAIYTWRRNASDVRPPIEVSGNVILDVAGDTSVKYGVNDYLAGIYLDEFTRYATVKNNVIVGAAQGVYVHNAVQNAVTSNVIAGSRDRDTLEGVDRGRFANPAEVANELHDNLLMPRTANARLAVPEGHAAARPDTSMKLELHGNRSADVKAFAAPDAASGSKCRSVEFPDSDPQSRPPVSVLDCP